MPHLVQSMMTERRSWSRERRLRATRHRQEIPPQILAVLGRRPGIARHRTPRLPTPVPTMTIASQRELDRRALLKLQARRDRMAALIRGVREPCHHGALRKAILEMDANIIALRRALVV